MFSSFLIYKFFISLHFSFSDKYFIDLYFQEQHIGNFLSDSSQLSECLSVLLDVNICGLDTEHLGHNEFSYKGLTLLFHCLLELKVSKEKLDCQSSDFLSRYINFNKIVYIWVTLINFSQLQN